MNHLRLFESQLKLHPSIVAFLQYNARNSNIGAFLMLLDLRYDNNATDLMNFLRPNGDDGVFFSRDNVFKNTSVENFNWVIQKDTIKVGRIVKSLLGDKISDRELEIFVNSWKSYFSKKNDIKIVSGEEIRYWYNHDNYNADSEYNSLGKSCMSYYGCQGWLDIYVQNPKVCSLVIMTDGDNKLMARALLWKTTNGVEILDRIYTTHTWNENQIIAWAKENFPDGMRYDNGVLDSLNQSSEFIQFINPIKDGGKVKVKLDKWKFKTYPYLDNIRYLNYNSGILSEQANDKRNPIALLGSTSGGFSIGYQWVHIEDGDIYILRKDAEVVDDRDGRKWARKKGIIQKFKSFFESKDNEYDSHFQVIKDIFQDIFDEYDIYEFVPPNSNPLGYLWRAFDKCYFNTNQHLQNKNTISLAIWYSENGRVITSKTLTNIDFDSSIKRLESLGYKISKTWIDNARGELRGTSKWISIKIDYSEA